MGDLASHYLEDVRFTLRWYKNLAERALVQVSDEDLHRAADRDANSIAIVMKHMAGNMRSRWTGFLTTDGEKTDRNRDGEFIDDIATREALMRIWEDGWACVLGAIDGLQPAHLMQTVTIRGREHTVVQAIHRQIAHYSYHIGQIVGLARSFTGSAWESLSIPRGQSRDYVPKGRL